MIRHPASLVRALVSLAALSTWLLACSPRRDLDVVGTDATDRGVICFAPHSICGGECINPQTDSENCGACGHACPSGQACTDGACALACPMPQEVCGAVCSNPMTDPRNCGGCGFACANGLVCSMGRCDVNCSSGLTACDGIASPDGGMHDSGTSGRYCADVRVDRNNCGACGAACPSGQLCVEGVCAQTCPGGQAACAGECVDVMTNPAHCGACGAACPGGQTCVGGACSMMCPTGQMYCTDRCLDVREDRTNCGACGNRCADGQVCVAGACAFACPMDRVNCSMRCIDTNTDRTNCGACGATCASGQTCVAGACRATCASGTTSCGGACVDLTNNRANCGACGTACAATQFCVGGACGASCLPGQSVCGGICVNTQLDSANCGYCGGQCGVGYGCLGGYCRPLQGTDASGCTPPSVQCGATCTDIRNDNNNCGGCGTVCSPDRTCVTGMCVATCAPGEMRCGSVCTSVQFDRANCGACGNVCAAGLSCGLGVCTANPTFRVDTMTTAGCRLSPPEDDFATGAGDDCGGLAVGRSSIVYTGDSASVRLPADISTVTRVSSTTRYGGLVSDLRDGTMYAMLTAAGAPITDAATVTQLGELDATTGVLTTNRVVLSQPLTFAYGSGIYSGYGRAIFFTAGTAPARGYYNVDLPSGTVTPIITGSAVGAPPGAASCETFAHWGTAEYFANEYHVLYVRSTTPVGIARLTPRTGVVDTALVSDFAGDRGDVCMAIFSPMNNRWYWHAEGIPAWGGTSVGFAEVVGYCPGTWSAP